MCHLCKCHSEKIEIWYIVEGTWPSAWTHPLVQVISQTVYRDSFDVQKKEVGQKRSFEYSKWNITWQNNRMTACVIYHRPYSQVHRVPNSVFLEEIEAYFEEIVLCDGLLLIAGDFNLHLDVPSDPVQRQFRDILTSLGLVNHVNIPTHKHGHTLDLIITRNCDELILSQPVSGFYISDHCFIQTKVSLPKPDLVSKTVSVRKIKSMYMTAFKNDLQLVCNDLLSLDDINTLALEYDRTLGACLDKHAPTQTKTMVVRPKVPWFDPSIKRLKQIRRRTERNWKRNKSDPNLRDLFHQARNSYSYHLHLAKKTHFSNAINDASGDQKKLYNIIKSLTSVNHENPLPNHDSLLQLANDFGNFFIVKIETIRRNIDSITTESLLEMDHSPDCEIKFSSFKPLTEAEVRKLVMKSKPTTCDLDPIPSSLLKECIDIVLPVLTKMVNLSLQSGTVPESWKLALVIPLIKKLGLQLIYPNYRPVSNLPFIGKLTERAVIDQEKSHMKLNCPLPDLSSAYRDGHSTESALIKVQSDILHNM